MATQTKLSKEQEAIVAAQNAAGSRLPDNADARRKLIFDWRTAQGREADAVAKVKEEVGAAALLKALTKKHGLEKPALDFIKAVFTADPLKRASAIRQVFIVSEDYGWIIRDLFDDTAFGSAAHDDGQGNVFDQTRTGQSQGGAKAQPRTTEEMAASHAGPAPTPGLDLTTPEARQAVIAKYEEAALARKGKRGPKSPEFKELEANAELAKEAEKAAQAPTAGASETPPAPPKEEPSNVVSFAKQQGEANAAGEAHIREQAAKLEAERNGTKAADPAPEKKARASRAKPKDAAPPAPPAEQQASDEQPPAPPVEDDDEDEGKGPDFPSAPMAVGGPQVGDQPSTYTVR